MRSLAMLLKVMGSAILKAEQEREGCKLVRERLKQSLTTSA
jgi:hypothetical protein